MLSEIVTVAALSAFAYAEVHDVDVGEDGLVFNPTSVTAAVGDTVNFHFYPGDHSVAQSTFEAPCMPSGDDAIYSGFLNPTMGQADMMFQVVVNSTDPLWLYCSQGSHCQSGMVMAINPTDSMTVDMYTMAANNANMNTSPGSVAGGALVANMEGQAAPGASGTMGSSSVASSMMASSMMSSMMESSMMMSSTMMESSMEPTATSMMSSMATGMSSMMMTGSSAAPSMASTAAQTQSTGAAAPTNMGYPMAMAGAAVAAVAGALL